MYNRLADVLRAVYLSNPCLQPSCMVMAGIPTLRRKEFRHFRGSTTIMMGCEVKVLTSERGLAAANSQRRAWGVIISNLLSVGEAPPKRSLGCASISLLNI